ncbi:MAG: hypothetical protein F6J94_12890 [Moorea sp. SIO1F2]|uniref:MAPEG family protein n=1 Tax=Moorena sp. SIO1F2 TaxID=2607819 RepID=UPI0013B6ABE5|nr:MAPEG family protein [Moorena sp. SIO1F2]NET82787.1 hypothetical protein [Moorena sp. SIO1F2]
MHLSGSGILLYCIVGATVLIYLPYLVVAYSRFKLGYDQSAPRAMFDQLPPYAQRATWAHQNSFETFIVFSAAALMAYITGQNSTLAIGCAIAFVIARVFYSVFYILDIPLGRSLMFGIGSLSTGTLFVLSLSSVSG